jgi:hypothetical protein
VEADAKSHPLFPAAVLGHDWDRCCLEYIVLLRDIVSVRNTLGLELGADRIFPDGVYGYAQHVDGVLWDRCVDRFCDYAYAGADHLEVTDVSQEEDWSDEYVHGWNFVCIFSSPLVDSSC